MLGPEVGFVRRIVDENKLAKLELNNEGTTSLEKKREWKAG